jgi:ElaB/YqjD/DUF883 family membrane-anchored ribosome-binding protein
MEDQKNKELEFKQVTEELLEKARILREKSKATGKKLEDLKERAEELIHPHSKENN